MQKMSTITSSVSGLIRKKFLLDDKDRVRFIFLLTHFQSPVQINNISLYAKGFVKKGSFNIEENERLIISSKKEILNS